MFTRWKTIDGKKRRYLVESYRDEKGRPRQRHIAYVDLWPEADIEKLKQLHDQYAKALKEANRTSQSKADKQSAVALATKCQNHIMTFTEVMDRKMRKVRYYSDGRVGPERNKKPELRELLDLPPEPFEFFSKLHTRAAYQLRFLRAQVERFQSTPGLPDGDPKYDWFRLLKEYNPERCAEMEQMIRRVADEREQELEILHKLLRKLS